MDSADPPASCTSSHLWQRTPVTQRLIPMRAVSINFKIMTMELKDMTTFLVLWRFNALAPRPTDPAEMVKLSEMLNAQIDQHLKTVEI